MARKTVDVVMTDEETEQIVRLARRVINDPQYQTTLQVRANEGKLQANVECMLWYYAAKGKPAEQVNLNVKTGQEDLSKLSKEQLVQHSEQLREIIQSLPEESDPSGDSTIH